MRRSRKHKRVGKLVYPHLLEQEYRRQLKPIAHATQKAVLEVLLPMLSTLRHEEGFIDSAAGTLDDMEVRVLGRVFRYYPDRTIADIARAQGRKVTAFQKRQLEVKIGKAMGVNYFLGASLDTQQTEKLIDGFVETNVELIKSIPSEYYKNAKARILENIKGGMRVEELAEDLEARAHITESRATLIARDQTGKLYGQVNKERQKNAGIMTYVWRTVGDNRVRDAHAALEGQEFTWGQPPVTNDAGETNEPGEDYQCRCTGEPVLE